MDLSSLNDNQKTAVAWEDGSLLVLAGPGSGKTRVLTLRVARLLEGSPAKRFKVLAMTFTSKAAGEMRERVEKLVPEQRNRAWLTTFHAFAAEILRQHGSHAGLRPDFTILTQDADRLAVLEDALRAVRSRGIAVEREGKQILPLFDHRLARGYEDRPEPDPRAPEWLDSLFEEYLEQLRGGNRTDFATLLWFCHQILEQRPAIARQVRVIHPYVCVDEFQDTNLAQYRLLRLLVGPSPANLFVVADDDQIIYQWNGASFDRLRELQQDYRMEVIQLPENYRCPPQIIHIANRLISHNRERSPDKQPLVAARSDQGMIRTFLFPDEGTELAWLAQDLRQRALLPAHCGIIARTNSLLETAAQALREAGVPAYVARRKSEFESAPFRWLHAALRLAGARQDGEQLRRLSKAWFDLRAVELNPTEIERTAALGDGDLLRAWIETAQTPSADEILSPLRKFLLERLDLPPFLSAAKAWIEVADPSPEGEGFSEYAEERGVWNSLEKEIRRRLGTDDLTLYRFLQELDLESKTTTRDDAVRCMTIHAAKGLEFEHVYLIGMVEDQLPSFQAIKRKRQGDPRPLEEERRNCFVAITRTQMSLTLTLARRYGAWSKEPSRFLQEMGLTPIESDTAKRSDLALHRV